MNWRDYVIEDPAILAGKPLIKGNRLSVEFILELIAAGWAHEQILQNYPRLQREHILAAAAFAKDRLAEERIFATVS